MRERVETYRECGKKFEKQIRDRAQVVTGPVPLDGGNASFGEAALPGFQRDKVNGGSWMLWAGRNFLRLRPRAATALRNLAIMPAPGIRRSKKRGSGS